ncbi:MAG: hypothetical protein JWM34_3362 [Ilumatobacteraceae bacterium]|nr:hypothetical protein [Ilumatobacteraceae bacterium]
MRTISPLSPTYAAARTAFLAAARAAGADIETTVHPRRGLEGEELAVDVASLGPPDAEHVVVVLSATHGVEGYAGSALQRHWLETCADERPPAARLMMVHGLNPFGFSWVRRVNEDNVDLNRNFIDWSATPPSNPGYDRIADLLVPAEWTEAEQTRTVTELLGVVAEIGMTQMQADVSGGQYFAPTGVFYGGTAPVWSHVWLRDFARRHLAAALRVGILDLHTGLGEWGHGELIGSESVTSAAHQRAAAWWGDVRSMVDGASVSAALSGDWLAVAAELAPQAEVTGVAIEYGTVDTLTSLQALRADAWLHGHGDPTGPEAPAIRAALRAAFADDDPAWIEALWPRFAEVLGAAFHQLAA